MFAVSHVGCELPKVLNVLLPARLVMLDQSTVLSVVIIPGWLRETCQKRVYLVLCNICAIRIAQSKLNVTS